LAPKAPERFFHPALSFCGEREFVCVSVVTVVV